MYGTLNFMCPNPNNIDESKLQSSRRHYFSGYNLNENKSTLIKRMILIYNENGLLALLWRLIKAINNHFKRMLMYKIVLPFSFAFLNPSFHLDGKKYEYFINKDNSVYTERVVELAYILNYIDLHKYENILEIGNVLSKYVKTYHIVLDKYEKGANIINEDAVVFNPGKKFRKIISISTFEHIGFDEVIFEPGKIKKALKNVIDLLEDNGELLITVPLGYNPEIEEIIRMKEINFSKTYFLKRYSKLNLWKETSLEDAIKYPYGSIYPAANAIAILSYRKREI
jgi:hypothetical protein